MAALIPRVQQLPAGQWYRFEVDWDFVINKIYSTLATEALGGGPVFGLYPDFLTIGSLSQPAVTGSPLFPASNFFVPVVPFGTGQQPWTVWASP